jgi:UDP-glucose 4-epimerase
VKILITGVAGFIGSHLADALVKDHEVSGIDNLSTGRIANIPDGVDFTTGDIRFDDPGSGYDLVYHCAASYKDREAWERDASTNVTGTINVLRTGARIVYFQTSLCYGPARGMVSLDAPLDPRGSYAISKTAGESYIRGSGLDYVSLRLANMYGPRNLSGPVPTFAKNIAEGTQSIVVDSRRDFVYIDDLIRLALAAGTEGQGVYHASSGRDVSIAELYVEVAAAMGSDLPAVQRKRGADDVATLLLDPARTFEDFGWIATTPLTIGIRETIAWYRDHPVTETYTHLSGATR